MEAIKATVAQVLQQLTSQKPGANQDLSGLLKKSLTKKELRHIRIHYFKKGILGLSVDSSAWLYSFSLQKQSLISRLKKQCGGIKDIRLAIGETR